MAAVTAALPDGIEPMSATLSDRRDFPQNWLFEPKLDGVRVIAMVVGGRARLWSRNRKRLDGAYPEVVEALERAAPRDCVLDGEVVALCDGVSSFACLQQRSGLRDPQRARESGVPVHYYVFDLLRLGAEDLRGLPLVERKRRLVERLGARPGERTDRGAGDVLRVVAHRTGDARALFADACRAGLEGLIAKDPAAGYGGGRSERWLKLKCVRDQELVVGGWTDPQGSRTGLGALLVGYYDEERRLRYAGKVGTGFDASTLAALVARLRPLERDDPPFVDRVPSRGGAGVHWVRPALVVQIGFAEWTAKGRLRQPRYLGMREDKRPRDVVRERAAPAGAGGAKGSGR